MAHTEDYKSLNNREIKPLTERNVKEVYEMCENNVRFLSHSFEIFHKATMESPLYDPDLTLVSYDLESKVNAFFMVVFRRSNILNKYRKVAVLKFFVVRKDTRNKGLGTALFNVLNKRIKNSDKKCFRMKFEVMTSQPDY
ncbi:MAG: GNAT family N-acetyltransferase, partial [Candidatus Lokiarchaeota archaeon]|nr:GNAT family N-acetyltransferase [Candidatus Lokiarchaeota archaeon]MBD3341134.1 GNAT family N-acetyltransferase [Candidatus Lokiarchaeota archaeon]